MAARTIPSAWGLFTILREILYSLAEFEVEPLAAPYVPTFQGHRNKWQTVLLKEIAITEAIARAQAAVDKSDRALDRFVDKVFNLIDEHTDGDTNKKLKKALLKGKQKARFRKPVLGRQLRDMKDWGDILESCGVPALAALANEARTLWAAGDAADEQRAAAKNANRNFRDLGERKQFIDELNGSRKETDGALAKMPFQNPALPPDFNDGFFLGDEPREEDETIEDVKTAIDDLQKALKTRQEQLAQMEKDAAEEAKAAEARKVNTDRAAQLRAQAKALLEEADGLDTPEK